MFHNTIGAAPAGHSDRLVLKEEEKGVRMAVERGGEGKEDKKKRRCKGEVN